MRAGGAMTRELVLKHIIKVLQLRRKNNGHTGRYCAALSHSALHLLHAHDDKKKVELHNDFWQRFLHDHPEIRLCETASRPTSIQRMLASNYENFELLQARRLKAATDTGILDPETNTLDVTRVFNMDEAPLNVDGTVRGNNIPQVFGKKCFCAEDARWGSWRVFWEQSSQGLPPNY